MDSANKLLHHEILFFQYLITSWFFSFAGHFSSFSPAGHPTSFPPLTLGWSKSQAYVSFSLSVFTPRGSHSEPGPCVPSVHRWLSKFCFQVSSLFCTLNSIKDLIFFLYPIAYSMYLLWCLTEILKLISQNSTQVLFHTYIHTHTCLLLLQSSPEGKHYLHFPTAPDKNLGVILEFALSLLLHLYSISNALALPSKCI